MVPCCFWARFCTFSLTLLFLPLQFFNNDEIVFTCGDHSKLPIPQTLCFINFPYMFFISSWSCYNLLKKFQRSIGTEDFRTIQDKEMQ